MSAYDYARDHRAEFLRQLKQLLAIPSISTEVEHKADIEHTAAWLVDHLKAIGLEHVQTYQVPAQFGSGLCNPVVYGDWLHAPGKPTVLIYGHYDVQPVDDPEGKWQTRPFEPVEKDGNLFARGATDDKGQVFAQVKAVESLFRAHNDQLPFNVKFMIEGEEELASINLDGFISKYEDLLRADVFVVSDSHILASDRPLIVYGLRGLIYTELEVSGPKVDLHSGSYGGVVHNPIQALCEIVAALHTPDGKVTVPGFYDKVRQITPAEHESIQQIPWTDEEFFQETGLHRDWGEQNHLRRERVGLRPTLELNGIFGGFMVPGGQKTVLPAKATAKISCRLVADQDAHEIFHLLEKHIQTLTPPTVTSKIRLLSTGDGARVNIDSPAIEAAAAAYEHGFGARPVFLPEGGSIPVVATIQKTFHIPALLMGFGLPDDGLHGPNEKFKIDHFYRGIDTMISLYESIA